MKLIDKDALVAEIERRKHRNLLNEGAFEEDIDILSLIKTLEVKEVDLDCNITGIKTKHAEGKLKECIESITEESLTKARKQLQKEPVSEIDFEQEIHKHFGQVKDFTLCVNIAKHFYDEGYFDGHIHDGDRIEHVDGRRVNVSRLQRVAKQIEEPASEELDVIAREYAGIPCDAPKDLTYCVHDKKAKYDAVLFGANWKEQQFEKNRLAHCEALTEEQAQIESDFVAKHLKENNRTPTFLDAIEYGMDLQKQQMMKDAIDTTIKEGCTDLGIFIKGLDKTKFSFGDTVKVIVIKED